MDWRLKRTENSDSETVEYFLYDPKDIPGFNVKDYSIKFYWLVTRFIVNSDVWIDCCSWSSGKHVYNVITCKGLDAYNQIKPYLNNNPFTIPSKAVVCSRYFFPELLPKILSKELKEHQAITNFLQIFDTTIAVPLDCVNAKGFWTDEELLDYGYL